MPFIWIFLLSIAELNAQLPNVWPGNDNIGTNSHFGLPPPFQQPLPSNYPPTNFWDARDKPSFIDRVLAAGIDRVSPQIVERIIRFCRAFPKHSGCRKYAWNLPALSIMQEPPPIESVPTFPPVPVIPQLSVLIGVPQALIEESPPMAFIELSEDDKKALLKTCEEQVKCMEQDEASTKKRSNVRKYELTVAKRVYPAEVDLERRIELRLLRTQQVKESMLQLLGISDKVVPNDDGIFQNDVLLSIEQSNYLINAYKDPKSRKKRQSLFLDDMPNAKWNISQPIVYFFDISFDDSDKDIVHNALINIASRTCIKFKQANEQPENTYLLYVKVDDLEQCGLSYIGRDENVNPIYLNFNCENQVGITIHETLHALGLNHEQLRWDRDDYIAVQWDNINPKLYDAFAIADMKQFTSYGVSYDYYSIMHYGPQSGAVDPNKPTLVPKYQRERFIKIIGQRRELSNKDVELLTAMYCNADCADKNVYCGIWALKRLCATGSHQLWMADNCKKSCGIC